MLTVESAVSAVLSRANPLPPRSVPLAAARGCVLAERVTADMDMPPFAKALVDGYAVRASDLAGGRKSFAVCEEILAGNTPTRALGAGEAAAIMTGAPVPDGADAVVMVERTSRHGPTVTIDDPAIVAGRNVMRRAREMSDGEVVASAGQVLTPARLGLLASVGLAAVRVVPRPRVAVVSTGDELVEPERVPGPGQIRNSNATVLRALAEDAGAEVESLPIAPDEPVALRETLRRGLAADLLLITGGVSAGTRDLVPGVLEGLGVERVFHKVRLKPGKPLWFGVGAERAGGLPGPLVFGLPGNPVSGIVGFLLFVRPALEALAEKPGPAERAVAARLVAPYIHQGDRPTYHPARWRAESGEAETLEWAGSADLRTVAAADGFAAFEAGDRAYAAGEIVRFLPLR